MKEEWVDEEAMDGQQPAATPGMPSQQSAGDDMPSKAPNEIYGNGIDDYKKYTKCSMHVIWDLKRMNILSPTKEAN
jgi:hypothetical protein